MAKCLYFHLFIVDGSMQYIIRLRRLHAVHRCGCLLQMLHVAWSVCLSVCVCACVRHTDDLCKNGWTDQVAVLGLTDVGLWNHILDGGLDPPWEGALLRGNVPDCTLFACSHGQCMWPAHVADECIHCVGWQNGDVAFCQIIFDTCYTSRRNCCVVG